MKKLALTIAIVLGLGMVSFADPGDGGMLGRGEENNQNNRESGIFAPKLPNHGETGNQSAPLGTGVMVLTALGAAYLVGKRRKED